MRKQNYRIIPYPLERQLIVDVGRLGRKKHTIYGLLEVDVTATRQLIREYRIRTGSPLSLTAFAIHCLARAIEQHRLLNAYRTWFNRLVIFDDVDVVVVVETKTSDGTFPFARIIRNAGEVTLGEIQREIESTQMHPIASRDWIFLRWFIRLPAFLREMVYSLFLKDARLIQRYMGTVIVTAVGMYGAGSGWGIQTPIHTLSVALGGITKKPAVVNGEIVVREYLSVTFGIDHDIIDGAPAARFARSFRSMLESGIGLTDSHG